MWLETFTFVSTLPCFYPTTFILFKYILDNGLHQVHGHTHVKVGQKKYPSNAKKQNCQLWRLESRTHSLKSNV
jgi:hypothetical protein